MSQAQRMHFLLEVLQVSPIALMTHLNSSSKVGNHPDAVFFPAWHEYSDWWPLWVHAWSRFCLGIAEDPSLSFFATMQMKDHFLGNVFWETFSDSFRHNLSGIHVFRASCSQLPARSGIFSLLVEVVYWTFGLKFQYPTLNLSFLGIIVKVKLPPNFAWTVLSFNN